MQGHADGKDAQNTEQHMVLLHDTLHLLKEGGSGGIGRGGGGGGPGWSQSLLLLICLIATRGGGRGRKEEGGGGGGCELTCGVKRYLWRLGKLS